MPPEPQQHQRALSVLFCRLLAKFSALVMPIRLRYEFMAAVSTTTARLRPSLTGMVMIGISTFRNLMVF